MTVHYCTTAQLNKRNKFCIKLKQESDTMIHERRLRFMRKLTVEL